MKKIIVASLAISIFTAGAAMAAGEATVTLPAKNGDVKFDHKKHQEAFKDCKPCHNTTAGGKIPELGKDWAHKTCRGCHEENKKGPTKCGECHKKS